MSQQAVTITDFVNLLDYNNNIIFNMTPEEVSAAVISGDASRVRQIEGQFAIVEKVGREVFMARSIGKPMRYFLAKQVAGPLLIVAERIDEIYDYLKSKKLHTQFHPSYTRMVPAHFVVRLEIIGCPDPNPVYTRYFEPKRNALTHDLDQIGKVYMEALAAECRKWLMTVPADEPIGVLFSGGIDSGSVFLVLHDLMLKMGMSPQRLKAFTLSVNDGPDAEQAHSFLERLGLSVYLEVIDVPKSAVDYKEAIKVIEDYKPLDLESATMALALCKQIRELYPEWKYLADGDGGDENLKDYPIEANTELTIRSVLNNTMLYQEGWGVDKIKHSLTYSGGQSRGHVRSYAPGTKLGFKGFSPYALPNVIEVAEGIPFIQLTDWNEEALYALKGEIVRRGIKALTGIDMPIFEKRRFQLGAASENTFQQLFPQGEFAYRTYFHSLYASQHREIERLRPGKNHVTPDIPYHFLHETEPDANGQLRRVNTIFLTGKECAFKCLMCDLWKNTLDEPTPRGAILKQLDYALSRLPEGDVIKLYNSSNFFDPKAVPIEDYPGIIERVKSYRRVIVENHPKLCGNACVNFARQLDGKLEIAMGLETIHPDVLPLLNKQMTVQDFAKAANFLADHGIDARAFILLNPPYLTGRQENIRWALAAVDFAFENGVKCCSIIPTRAGNGIMELLGNENNYVPPSLDMLEEVFEQALELKKGRVFVDTWDIGFLSQCALCFDARKNRLDAMNLDQQIHPKVTCNCHPVYA